MKIAERLLPNDQMIHWLHDIEGRQEVWVGTADNIKYVGISDMSVEIHFRDGSGIRITTPDFTDLNITAMDAA
jgi:hypothetical protein